MPVAGKEETAVKPVGSMSLNYIASVPIKKRKYLLYGTTSPPPPPEEPSSRQSENNAPQKDLSSISQGPILSIASIGTSSASLPDSNSSGSGVRKENPNATSGSALQRATGYIKVKLEEPNLTVRSNSLEEIASKEKLLGAELSAKRPITYGNTKVQLASMESLTLDVRKVINNKGESDEKCSSDASTITGNTELSLGLKENLILSSGLQESNVSHWNHESSGSLLLDLSLNTRKGNDQCKTNEVRSSTDNEKMPRSNWDLNTTMDAWEGPERDAGTDQLAALGLKLNTGSGAREVKPVISSDLRTGVASEMKFIHKIDYKPNLAALSTSTDHQCNSVDSLNLRLSPSFLQTHFHQESSSISAKADSSKVVSNVSLPKMSVSAGTLASAGTGRAVKLEPFDENVNKDPKRPRHNLTRPEDHNRPMKHEFVERSNQSNLKLSSLIPPKFVNPRSVKSEAGDGNEKAIENMEGTSHHSGKHILGQYNHSSILRMTSTSPQPCPPGKGKTPCSTEMNKIGDVSNPSNFPNRTPLSHGNKEVPKESCSAAEVAPRNVCVSGVHVGKKSEAETAEDKDANAADPKFINQKLPVCPENQSAFVSDEEKVNISGDMIEDSYGSDYESDCNHAVVGAAMNTGQCCGGDDDYEDGEVRDPEVPTAKEGYLHEKNVEHFKHGEPDCKKVNVVGSLDDEPTSTHVEGKDPKSEDPGETKNNMIGKCDVVDDDKKPDKATCKFDPLQDSLAIQVPTCERENEMAIKRKPLDVSGKKDASEDNEINQVSNEAAGESQGTLVTAAQGADEGEKTNDIEEKNDSALSKMETSLTSDDGTKDISSGGNRSRIINLSQASNTSLPGKMRSIASRPLPSRVVKDRLPDVALDGEKMHPRGRDDIYMDGSPKFSRERHQDQYSRNSRWNFNRGRGRGPGRFDTGRDEWNSERDFDPEFYNGPTEYRIPRHKYTAPDADLEYSKCNMALDNGFVGTGRGGRKVSGDDNQFFRHFPSRRRSPGGRDGPAGRGLQMIRRAPRNVSPNRCIGDDGTELAGLRRNEKFMRGFPDDNMDPGFSHIQHPYEGGEGHFVRGNRNFSSGQRRGLPRIRSKSPVGSRTRSPGPWPSPRRRSPDGFSGHPEMPRRRSPGSFRIERMRSPERPCYPGDMVVRRPGSPPYMSRPNNDLRDMESSREHGHPRLAVPNRSPSGRILLRNNRRFDIVDPRERGDSDEYFGGPGHSGRFHELGDDGNGEDRRRFGERRGPVRPFRPPYNGADGENFRPNSEDATRPFRFGPEDDSEFNERGNTRESFDRRIKNRPGNAPRRPRNIEEQEGNFRNGGQPWHDEGFDERVKRKRF